MKCFLLAAALIIAIAATEGTVHCHGSYYWIYKIKVQKSAIDEKCNASKNIVVWYSLNVVVDLYVWLFAFDELSISSALSTFQADDTARKEFQ